MEHIALIKELSNLIFAEYGKYGVQEFERQLTEEKKRVRHPSDLGIYSVFEKTENRLIEEREALRLEEFSD
jgi:hypothetical protein